MSSSIELINPKAESVRRAAALQVISSHSMSFLARIPPTGQHNRRDGPRKCGEG